MTNITTHEIEGYIYLESDGAYFAGCRRCGGEGHYSFNGEHSRCYECDNTVTGRLGAHIGDRATAEKHAHKRAVAKARRDAKREAEAEARIVQMKAAQAAVPTDVREFLEAVDEENERSVFVRQIADRFHQYDAMVKWGGFTESQIGAVRRVIAERESQEAAKAKLGPIAEGRYEITGTIQSVKVYYGDFGTVYKMLVVQADGHKVFGTIPNSLWAGVFTSGEFEGREVTFTATVEQSHSDNTFGIFKRPTKSSLLP